MSLKFNPFTGKFDYYIDPAVDSNLSAGAQDAISKKHSQNTDTGTNSPSFSVGLGTDVDISIIAKNADVNPPFLFYDKATNKWRYSNDGVTSNDIGSGDGTSIPGSVIVCGQFRPDYYNGASNPGKFDVTTLSGQTVVTVITPASVRTFAAGAQYMSQACLDDYTGEVYVLISETLLNSARGYSFNQDSYVGLVLYDPVTDSWYYDNNDGFLAFTPVDSDMAWLKVIRTAGVYSNYYYVGTSLKNTLFQFSDSGRKVKIPKQTTVAINSGNFGVGTNTPFSKSDTVIDNAATSLDLANVVQVINKNQTENNISGLVLSQLPNEVGIYGAAIAGIHTSHTGGIRESQLALYTMIGNAIIERLRIDALGNVGINTTGFGTSAQKVLGVKSGTAPSTSPADMIQLWSADRGELLDKLHCMEEMREEM